MATTAAPALAEPRRRSRYRPNRTLIAGAVVIGIILIMAFFPGQIAPYHPNEFDYSAILQPPSAEHFFGTDNFGRDVFSRVIWAARVDMQIALFTTLVPFLAGTIIGAIAGYFGKWFDAAFGMVVNIVVVFPFLVLVIAIVAFLGPGLVNMYIAVSLVGWVAYGRLVRGEMLVQKQAEYALAARTMGYTPQRVIGRHLLPNVIAPAIVFWMTDMSLGILLGASLGYLGLGAQPPTAEWGVMVADGKNFMTTAPWISTFPALALTVAGLAFSLIGDGLADLLRPRK
ncbi:MAG: ABC transporter permease [Caldilineaceae bacterium]|nr:ABC transporter permease [Caldilineaceae bacterium]